MAAMNTKYTEIELCTIVLNAVNLTVLTAYYATVQNEFPTDINRLTSQLTRVCDQNKEHKRLLIDLASRMGLKTKDGTGNRVSMNTSTETIPRKTKGQKRGGGNPAASPGGATHGGDANGAKGGGCALCKKYNTRSPNAWKTHLTNDCKKYNKDGTTKLYACFGSGDGNAHNGKKSSFATMKR